MTVTRWRGALYADFYVKLPGRKPRRVRKKSPVQTVAAAKAYERQLVEAEHRLAGKPEKTFAEFVRVEYKSYALANNSPAEILRKKRVLEYHLLHAFGEMYLRDISAREIDAYKALKLLTLKPKTVANHLSVLRRALSLAKEYGDVESVPTIRMPKPEQQKFDFLTYEEAERFIAAALPRWRTMIAVALGTGLRVGELRALRWEDVDLERGVIRVCRNATVDDAVKAPKNGTFREVPLSERAASALRAHRHLRGPLVFCHENGRMLKEHECKHGPKTASRRAGIGRTVYWHVLRHTFASHLAMRGVPMRTLQELLGHSSLAMTQRYAHLAPNVPREAVKLLDLPAPQLGLGTYREQEQG